MPVALLKQTSKEGVYWLNGKNQQIWTVKALHTHTRVRSYSGWLDLRLKSGGFVQRMTRGHENPCNKKNDKGKRCLALTGAESREDVSQVNNAFTEFVK